MRAKLLWFISAAVFLVFVMSYLHLAHYNTGAKLHSFTPAPGTPEKKHGGQGEHTVDELGAGTKGSVGAPASQVAKPDKTENGGKSADGGAMVEDLAAEVLRLRAELEIERARVKSLNMKSSNSDVQSAASLDESSSSTDASSSGTSPGATPVNTTASLPKLGSIVGDAPLVEFVKHKACPTSGVTRAAVNKATIALITVSYDSPQSLFNSVESWDKGGLLDLVDEKVMFLSKHTDEEVELGKKHGFKVLTAGPHLTHGSYRSKHNFPNLKTDKKGRHSITVGAALLLALDEVDSDYVLFLEKDYVQAVSREVLVEEMSAAIQMLKSGIHVVRVRRLDDPNRSGIPNCCKGKCGNNANNFKRGKLWSSHMNWLYIFCDPDGIEKRSKENVKICHDHPNRYYCFNADHSGWSNNAHMWNRKWFLYGSRAHNGAWSSARQGNGWFELNNMGWYNWTPKPKICQSHRGMFDHKEIDK